MNCQILLNILADLSQVVVAIVAIVALDKWKEQMKGGGKYVVAKNLLVSARQIQEIIENKVRNPLLHPAEAGKDPDEFNWEYAVYQKRFGEMYSYKIESFDKHAIEAEIVLGESIKPLIKNLNERVDELLIAVRSAYNIFRGRDRLDDKEYKIQFQEKISKSQNLLWNIEKEGKEYTEKLQNAIDNLKKELDQYVR